MSIRDVPPAVRVQLYLFWAGMAIAGIGVVGFFLSFWQVGSATAAAIDVHEDVPVYAYASIAAWVAGLAVMWSSRRRLDAAVAAKLAEDQAGLYVDLGAEERDDEGVPTTAPDGRDS
ncbi:MAG: hypothetical protein JW733_04155 [Coriobacteriia bacterium]|nr:hypothetical protein [Coriobacteriia bacterium]